MSDINVNVTPEEVLVVKITVDENSAQAARDAADRAQDILDEIQDAGVVVVDATTTAKGVVKLAGDLGGTAENPTVPELAYKAATTYVDSQDTAKLAEAKTYSDGLIAQLINGAPEDANTLKELNDKILAVQAIIGGSTADGDALVNTVAELLAVFATFPEGVDLVNLLAGKVNTTDVYNALDCIVAGKVADARQLKVLNDFITALQTGKEDTLNKSNDVGDMASTTKFPVWKVISDWVIGRFQPKLVAGANIAIDNSNPLAPVISASSGGGGDMLLASPQTVSGLKTFLAGMFGLRNIANTFTSFITNANTASRTYTLKDRNGTLLDDTDYTTLNNLINGKAPTFAGTSNYLLKYLNATTVGISRFFDDGTFFGLGTANPATKDFTLGNQSDRTIGIENSSSAIKGRDLNVEAGKTINYLENSELTRIGGANTYSGFSISRSVSGDLYAGIRNLGVIKVALSGTAITLHPDAGGYYYVGDFVITYNGTEFASQDAGFTKKNGVNTTWFSSFLFSSRFSEKLYVIIGGMLKFTTNGGATFTDIQSVSLKSNQMTENSLGDVFFLVGGYLWKQTGGTGLFVNTNIPLLGTYVTCLNNNDIISASNTKLYRLSYGTTVAVEMKTIAITGQFGGFCSDANDRLMFTAGEFSTPQPIYLLETNSIGTANLDGGTLRHKAGTGKGTGKSRLEGWTGQKTTSGTDMQVLTKRYEYDENGHYTLFSIPTYSDNASAIAGGLTTGKFYRTATGQLMIVY